MRIEMEVDVEVDDLDYLREIERYRNMGCDINEAERRAAQEIILDPNGPIPYVQAAVGIQENPEGPQVPHE